MFCLGFVVPLFVVLVRKAPAALEPGITKRLPQSNRACMARRQRDSGISSWCFHSYTFYFPPF